MDIPTEQVVKLRDIPGEPQDVTETSQNQNIDINSNHNQLWFAFAYDSQIGPCITMDDRVIDRI